MGLGRDLLALGAMSELKKVRKAAERSETQAYTLAELKAAYVAGHDAGRAEATAQFGSQRNELWSNGYRAGHDAGYVKGRSEERGTPTA
jgi:hypothetical protein